MEEEEGHPTSPEGGAGARNVLSSVVFLLRCLHFKYKSIIKIKPDEPHVLDPLDPTRATPTYLSDPAEEAEEAGRRQTRRTRQVGLETRRTGKRLAREQQLRFPGMRAQLDVRNCDVCTRNGQCISSFHQERREVPSSESGPKSGLHKFTSVCLRVTC